MRFWPAERWFDSIRASQLPSYIMPRWDFTCEHCHTTTELPFPNLRATETATCRECGGKLTRQPASPNFTITGYNAKNGYSK